MWEGLATGDRGFSPGVYRVIGGRCKIPLSQVKYQSNFDLLPWRLIASV